MTSTLRAATLSHKQAEYAVRCLSPQYTHFELMYSGAIRAGKSVALLMALAARANRPGAREGLCRLELKTLKETTLRTLLYGDGEMPPILQPGSYTHHKTECVITFPKTGGQIVYFGMDDIQKSGSKSLSGCAVDEAAQFDETRWVWLSGRCSVRVDGMRPRIYGACNPDVPSHWIARRFGLALAYTPLPTCKAVRTNTFDNEANLTSDYLAQLATFTGMMRRRFVLGEWCGSDNLVYDTWQRDCHFVRRDGPWVRAYIHVDDASTLPFAAGLVLEDSDGRLHTLREVYSPGLTESPKLDAIRTLADSSPAPLEFVVVDPAASGLKLALANAGFPVRNGDNDVQEGIKAVRSRLAPGPDGKPRYTADPGCTHMAAEFESYERKEGTDEPVKKNDHLMDGLRYLCMAIKNPPAVVFDSSSLRNLEARCVHEPSITGWLEHAIPDGADQDVSLIKRKMEDFTLRTSRAGAGPVRFWCDVNKENRPSPSNKYAMFCVPCDVAGRSQTIVAIGDAVSRSIVADAVFDGPPERTAKLCAMLGYWFMGEGEPALLGWWHIGAMGTAFQAALKRVSYTRMVLGSKDRTEGWAPDKLEWSDAVGLLRVAWDQGQFHESDPHAIREAAGYGWHAGTVRPLAVAEDVHKWSTWGDRVIARAGLWTILRTLTPPEAPRGHRVQDLLKKKHETSAKNVATW